MDRGAWWAIVHGVTKNRTQLRNFHFHFTFTLIMYMPVYYMSLSICKHLYIVKVYLCVSENVHMANSLFFIEIELL